MVTQEPEREDLEGAVARACATCGHVEDEHEEHEEEVGGDTIHRVRCRECSDWHDFVPLPE